MTDSLQFWLEPGLNYRILLHDPTFYHVVRRSQTVPRVWLQFKSGQNMRAGHYEWHEITVTEHQLLNRPEQPCEEEEDYNFLQCVKTSQARLVGCRPPWDIWSPHTIPLCHTMDQLEVYEQLDLLNANYERRMLLKKTGCEIPCRYKEYKLAADPRAGLTGPSFGDTYRDSHFVFLFTLASTQMRSEREVLAYNAISLIADLGGALSLFVGVSALSVWDCCQYIWPRCKQTLNLKQISTGSEFRV